MGYLLCDNVGPGLRESEAGVTVHDITGRPQRLRVERDFLREANQRYYLPIGVVARDPAAPRVLIEFPHEADSGANRIWVAPDQLLGGEAQPQRDVAAQGRIHGKTIELDAELGIPDGQQVEIVVRVAQPKESWGEGIRRSAGVAANIPGADEAFDQIARERKAAHLG